MNNSHLLGLILFGVCALFAALTWLVAEKGDLSRSQWTRSGVRKCALAFLLGGLGVGYGAFALDNRIRTRTLYEVMVEGTPVGALRAGAGQPPAAREKRFAVEHPRVQHALMVAPLSDGMPQGPAEVKVRLLDERNSAVLDEHLKFFVQSRNNVPSEWSSRTLSFTPSSAARYTLQVTPLTPGIARVHVHIADPLKRNGTRLPGY